MESSYISTKSLALSYAGFYLGAGYLSGQELWQYFGAYGSIGFIGFAINAVMLAVLGIMLFSVARKTGITEFENLIIRWEKPFIRRVYAFSVILFSYCVIIIMAAGSGALLEQVFALPSAIGSGIFCLIVATVSMKGIDGMLSAFNLLVPVLTAVTLLISLIALIKNGGAPIEFVPASETNPLAGNWATSTLVYLSYNFFGSVCVFVPIAGRIDKVTSKRGAVLGCAMLVFIAVSILFSLAIYPDAPYAQLPMLFVASSISGFLGYLCAVPLLSGMFGTSISSLVAVMNYGEQNWSIFKTKRLLVTALLVIVAWIFSLFGFSTLVGTVYPIFGYIGLATIVFLVEHCVHLKKNNKYTPLNRHKEHGNMKKTIRENIKAPYSLHDMNVISFEDDGNTLIMRTQSGMSKTTPPFTQPDGYVEFQDVDWDFCYVYILNFTGNVGSFTGEKLFLKEFIQRFNNACFSIIDENYGYNQTKYAGFLSINQAVKECIVEIYHNGDMIFVTEE